MLLSLGWPVRLINTSFKPSRTTTLGCLAKYRRTDNKISYSTLIPIVTGAPVVPQSCPASTCWTPFGPQATIDPSHHHCIGPPLCEARPGHGARSQDPRPKPVSLGSSAMPLTVAMIGWVPRGRGMHIGVLLGGAPLPAHTRLWFGSGPCVLAMLSGSLGAPVGRQWLKPSLSRAMLMPHAHSMTGYPAQGQAPGSMMRQLLMTTLAAAAVGQAQVRGRRSYATQPAMLTRRICMCAQLNPVLASQRRAHFNMCGAVMASWSTP